jgi:hypothetical protein
MTDSTTFIEFTSHVNQATAVGTRTPRCMVYCFYTDWVLSALIACAVLVATSADAQMTPPSPPASAASQKADAPVTAPPKYSATDIERAFNFIDANKDGKISREEAAGFRNVAKHFDAADIDKDGTLSLAEFGNALNRP